MDFEWPGRPPAPSPRAKAVFVGVGKPKASPKKDPVVSPPRPASGAVSSGRSGGGGAVHPLHRVHDRARERELRRQAMRCLSL